MLRLILLVAFASVFASCNHSQTAQTKTVAKAPEVPSSNLDKENTGALVNLLNAYYGLKDALVATDSAHAEAAASRVVSTAEELHFTVGKLPQGSTMQPQLENVMKAGDSIVSAKGIEAQRSYFAALSDAMLKVVRTAGLKHGGAYVQHCPMALDGKGADWLSKEEEIKNPYYGKQMLECGDVKDSL